MPMDKAKMKASLRALDNIEAFLDDRDAEEGRKFKGSETDEDDSDHGAPPSDDNAEADPTQASEDASDEEHKDAPEGESNWMDDLKGMAKKGSLGSKKALKSLSDDEDEE